MQRIKFTSGGCNATLGNFSSGDTANVSDALAKHLIEDAKCAVLLDGAQEKPDAEVPDPATLTVPGLRAALDAKGISYKSNATKAELLVLVAQNGG